MGVLMIVGVLSIGAVVCTVLMSIGASVAGIEGRTWGKAFMTVLAGILAGWAAGFVLSLVGMGNGFIGMVAGLVVNLFVIRSVYDTSWGKALGAWFVEGVAAVVLIGLPIVALIGTAALFG